MILYFCSSESCSLCILDRGEEILPIDKNRQRCRSLNEIKGLILFLDHLALGTMAFEESITLCGDLNKTIKKKKLDCQYHYALLTETPGCEDKT